MNNTKTECAWHYTVGAKVYHIAQSGVLRPTDSHIEKNEKPILWFSLEQDWEPTVCKGAISEDGDFITLSKKETSDSCGGLARFGMRKDRHILIPWPKVGRKARMHSEIILRLEEVGKKQGANPKLWMGALKPIRIKDVDRIQFYRDGHWAEAEGDITRLYEGYPTLKR